MAKILVTFRGTVLKEVLIQEETTRIGRDPSNHICLDNPAVSRFHAEIYRQGYSFFLEDKKSTNGTYLNDTFLNWKRGLNHNDRIVIGKHTLVFQLEPKDIPGKLTPGSFDSGETVCIVPGGNKP